MISHLKRASAHMAYWEIGAAGALAMGLRAPALRKKDPGIHKCEHSWTVSAPDCCSATAPVVPATPDTMDRRGEWSFVYGALFVFSFSISIRPFLLEKGRGGGGEKKSCVNKG